MKQLELPNGNVAQGFIFLFYEEVLIIRKRESVDADEVVREIDKLLQDCRGNDPVAVRK